MFLLTGKQLRIQANSDMRWLTPFMSFKQLTGLSTKYVYYIGFYQFFEWITGINEAKYVQS